MSLGGQEVRKWPEWTIVKDLRLKGHTAEKKGQIIPIIQKLENIQQMLNSFNLLQTETEVP